MVYEVSAATDASGQLGMLTLKGACANRDGVALDGRTVHTP